MARPDARLRKLLASDPGIAAAHRESQLAEIARTLDMAEIRCISFDQLLTRIERLWDDDAASQIVYRACQKSFSNNQIHALAESVRRLADAAEGLPRPAKSKALRAVKQILARMPMHIVGPIAEPWLMHKHKFRREIAYRVFRGVGVAAEVGPRLLAAFHRNGDQECIQLIARSPAAVAAVDAADLLALLEDDYWRMRVIEALLTTEETAGVSFSYLYPYEFAWAVGRKKDTALLPGLLSLFNKHSNDLDFLSIYVWALGQLGAQDHLSRIRELINHT
jgi:hypothetical protein